MLAAYSEHQLKTWHLGYHELVQDTDISDIPGYFAKEFMSPVHVLLSRFNDGALAPKHLLEEGRCLEPGPPQA